MRLHHVIDENGNPSFHWYIDLKVSKSTIIKNLLIDTGASISTLNIKSLARIYKQNEKDVIKYLKESAISDRIIQYTATNDSVELYGICLRNVFLDDVSINTLKVYTRLDGYVSNLIGVDVLAACKTELQYSDNGIILFDSIRYSPNTDGTAEMKSLIERNDFIDRKHL